MKRAAILFAVAFATLLNVAKAQNRDSVTTLPEVTITAYNMVNEQLDKSFIKHFPDAYDIVWSKLNKDYLAKFIKDDLKHQSLFKTNGYLKYDITYMNENNLPDDIRSQVTGAYDGYTISNAAKVVRSNQEFWIVNLESIKNYLVLRVENGNIEEVKRIVRSE